MKINKISVFISIELHYLQNWNQKVTFDRFWKNLIHAWINSSFDESLLRMASSSHNKRLLNLSLLKKLSYLFGCLITIHHQHVAIHKYQLVAASIFIFIHILFDYFYCFLSVHCPIANTFYVYFSYIF